MKYLSLLLPLFVLGSLLGEMILPAPPAAFGGRWPCPGQLEGDPNTIVHGSVNVITGDYVDLPNRCGFAGIRTAGFAAVLL